MQRDDSNHSRLQAALALNERASARVLRGIELLSAGDPDSLRSAIKVFDAAIELRRDLPDGLNPWFRFGHVAGWLNRGDAFTRLGGAANLAEALRSYEEALRLLQELPLAVHPDFRRRLAIAWLNRGLTLLCQGGAPAIAEALRSLDQAGGVLAEPDAVQIEDREILLAAICLNRAVGLLRLRPAGAAPAAWSAARRSCAFVASRERFDPGAAEMGLKGRHLQCQAIAHWLAEPGLTESKASQLLDEASDLVDGGLALARHWEEQGALQFGQLSRDLFLFGARVYQVHQPRFLVEFLLEYLDPEQSGGTYVPDHTLHTAAVEALWRAVRALQKEGFPQMATPEFDEVLRQLGELRVAEARLAELRARPWTAPS